MDGVERVSAEDESDGAEWRFSGPYSKPGVESLEDDETLSSFDVLGDVSSGVAASEWEVVAAEASETEG